MSDSCICTVAYYRTRPQTARGFGMPTCTAVLPGRAKMGAWHLSTAALQTADLQKTGCRQVVRCEPC
jgi:hypothetical protein